MPQTRGANAVPAPARLAVTPAERAEQAEEALRRIVVLLADQPGLLLPRVSAVDRIILAIACDALEIDEPICAGNNLPTTSWPAPGRLPAAQRRTPDGSVRHAPLLQT